MGDWTDYINEPKKKPVKKTAKRKVKPKQEKKTPKAKEVKPKKEKPIPPKIEEPQTEEPAPTELDLLIDEARKSEYRTKLSKEKEARFKAETERLKMEKEAGKVGEFTYMDALFFDFMERTFQEMGRMTKKLHTKIEAAVQEKETMSVIKILEAEIGSSLKGIKRDQKRALERWEDK